MFVYNSNLVSLVRDIQTRVALTLFNVIQSFKNSGSWTSGHFKKIYFSNELFSSTTKLIIIVFIY